jgi:predicted TPR repeat methyltransferase
VFANAVLLHLTVNQLDDVLTKAARAVGARGLLAFTVKEGEGEAWTIAKIDKPRYFAYWNEAAMRARLTANGWEPLSIKHERGGPSRGSSSSARRSRSRSATTGGRHRKRIPLQRSFQ